MKERLVQSQCAAVTTGPLAKACHPLALVLGETHLPNGQRIILRLILKPTNSVKMDELRKIKKFCNRHVRCVLNGEHLIHRITKSNAF